MNGIPTNTEKTLSGIVSYNSDITNTNTLQANTLQVSTSIFDNGSLQVLGLTTLANVVINGTFTIIAALITFTNITVSNLGTFLNITATGLTSLFNLTVSNITNLFTLNVSGLSSLFNLTVSGITTLQNTTCNTLTAYGQTTFSLIPILPSGYQFLTTIAQTITGAKTFSSSVNTSGIVDNLSITTPLLTLSNSLEFNDSLGGSIFSTGFSQFGGSFLCNLANTNNQFIWRMTGLAQPILMTLNSAGLYMSSLLTCQNGLTVSGDTMLNGPLLVSTINRIDKTAPLIIYSGTVPLPTTGTASGAGLMLGWNSTLGGGECDLISMGQSGAGGFNFYTVNVAIAPCSLLMSLNGGGLTITPPITSTALTSTGLITADHFVATNASASSGFWNMSASTISTTNIGVSANATFSGTSTFNVNHPTTTLGNNISSNTTQYSTVGYVNSTNGPSLLPLNNNWTGQNSFYSTSGFINIGNAGAPYSIGCGHNTANIIVGDSNSLLTSGGGSISIGKGSQYTATSIGGNNINIGGTSFTSITSGINNVAVGANVGNIITTGNSNTILGSGAWTTGANYSNCSCLGYNSTPTSNNQVVLGTSAETVICPNNVNVAGTLTSTNITSTNITCTGNITYPIIINSSFSVNVVLTYIPPFYLYYPNGPNISLTYPAPSPANAGQVFVVRRYGAGGGQTLNLLCVGNLAVWCASNAGPGGGINYAITTTWQVTFLSTGSVFLQIA